ncbi:MAG TPA: A/G-specific adenine glycosylase, partial [Bacteroidales bacterium]|nr:A/G-specific adenine glycosylase [Bacteroidales bacterium]
MKGFTEKLLSWYELAHRKLPWRVSTDPYRVWLSEIILQQTRVSQGMSYYLDFITQYPDVASLAKASEVEVLKMWQGLGYYSRARNMLHAARQVVNEYGGRFPDNRDDLLSLKGIGNYTAAAISSISFGETVPVVDGNVKRVVARIFGVQSTGQALYDEVEALMASYIHHERPGDFNQAVMEFGALQCIPRNPDCEACIFSDRCYALKNGMISELPGKEPRSRPKERYFSY